MAPRTYKEIAAEQLGESYLPGQPERRGRLNPVQPTLKYGGTGLETPQSPFNLRDELTSVMAQGTQPAAQLFGASEQSGYELAKRMMKLAEMYPGIFAATSGSDALNSARQGNYGTAAMEAGGGGLGLYGMNSGTPGGGLATGALMMAPDMFNSEQSAVTDWWRRIRGQ